MKTNYEITQEEFMAMSKEVFSKAENLLLNKNIEYGNSDKFHNFNAAGALRKTTPETALGGMLIKHIISVYDMIDQLEEGVENPLDRWDEKLIDVINYMVILRGLVKIRAGAIQVITAEISSFTDIAQLGRDLSRFIDKKGLK